MSNNESGSLSVVMRELPAVRVACALYRPEPADENMGRAIRERFERVQAWLEEMGYDPYTRLTIGSIWAVDEQLLRYECCIEVPEEVEDAPEGIRIKNLPGGKYAVVTIAKDAQLILEAVRRFHEEYVPQNGVEVDARRPTYEYYFADVMEYCVPVL